MILSKFFWAFIFIPFVVGFIQFKKLNKSHRFLYGFILVGTLSEISNKIIKEFFVIKSNMPLGHLYILISFIFLALFYLYELKNLINKKIIISIIILYELFSLYNVIRFQSHLFYPSVPGALSALILVTFSVLLFANILRESKIQVLSASSLIWINSAVLLYYAGNFFFYSLYNFILSNSYEFLIQIIDFFRILNAIFYILIAIGIWKAGQHKHT
jgi:hypothetical protein